MGKAIKIILKIINTIIVSVCVIIAILIIGMKLLGVQMFTVLSGSMEPEYPTASLIFVKEVEASELEIGDVITFRLGENTTATHRIVEVIEDSDKIMFRTKGDANDIEDASPVASTSVIGTPFFTIPEAGHIANYVQTPSGKKSVAAIGAALILFVFVTDFVTSDKKKTGGGSENENN